MSALSPHQETQTALPLAPLANGGAILPDQMTSKSGGPVGRIGLLKAPGCLVRKARLMVRVFPTQGLDFVGGGGAEETRGASRGCPSRLSSLERVAAVGRWDWRCRPGGEGSVDVASFELDSIEL